MTKKKKIIIAIVVIVLIIITAFILKKKSKDRLPENVSSIDSITGALIDETNAIAQKYEGKYIYSTGLDHTWYVLNGARIKWFDVPNQKLSSSEVNSIKLTIARAEFDSIPNGY